MVELQQDTMGKPEMTEKKRADIYQKASDEARVELINESKKAIAMDMPLLEGKMIQIARNIDSESDMFAWGWHGDSRREDDTDREYIARAIRDIYYPADKAPGDLQPGTTIYPGICAASQETLEFVKSINEVKGRLKEHLTFLNKFKYMTESLVNGESVKVQKRRGEQALLELRVGQIHKMKLYREIKYTEKPIHRIGAFWGTSPKMEKVTRLDAEKLIDSVLSKGDPDREDAFAKLSKLRPSVELALVHFVQGKHESVPFKHTAPRLNFHYYQLSKIKAERDLGIEKSYHDQRTAVMPFFYLHRDLEMVDINELYPQAVIQERSQRKKYRLKPKPMVVTKAFEIYRYL